MRQNFGWRTGARMNSLRGCLAMLVAAFFAPLDGLGADPERATVAVLPFQVHNDAFKSWGAAREGLADLMQAELTARSIPVVDRAQVKSLCDERGLQEMTSPEAVAARVGGLTGARFLISGHVIVTDLDLGGVQVWVRLTDATTTESLAAIPVDAGSMADLAQKLPDVVAQVQKCMIPGAALPPDVGRGVLARQDGLWLCRALQSDLVGRPELALAIVTLMEKQYSEVKAVKELARRWFDETYGLYQPRHTNTTTDGRGATAQRKDVRWVFLPTVYMSLKAGAVDRAELILPLQFEMENALRETGGGSVHAMGDLLSSMGESDLMSVQAAGAVSATGVKDTWLIPDRAVTMSLLANDGTTDVTLRMAARDLAAPDALVEVSTNVSASEVRSSIRPLLKSLCASFGARHQDAAGRFTTYSYPLPEMLGKGLPEQFLVQGRLWGELRQHPEEPAGEKWITLASTWRGLGQWRRSEEAAAIGIRCLSELADPLRALNWGTTQIPPYDFSDHVALHTLTTWVYPRPIIPGGFATAGEYRDGMQEYLKRNDVDRIPPLHPDILRVKLPLELSKETMDRMTQVIDRLPTNHVERLFWESSRARWMYRNNQVEMAEQLARRIAPNLEQAAQEVKLERATSQRGWIAHQYVKNQYLLWKIESKKGNASAAKEIAAHTREQMLAREQTRTYWREHLEQNFMEDWEAVMALRQLDRAAGKDGKTESPAPGTRTPATLKELDMLIQRCHGKTSLGGADEKLIRDVPAKIMSVLDDPLNEIPCRSESLSRLLELLNYMYVNLSRARNSTCKEAAHELRGKLLDRIKQSNPPVRIRIMYILDPSDTGLKACEEVLVAFDSPEARIELQSVLADRVVNALLTQFCVSDWPTGLNRPEKVDPRPYAERFVRVGGTPHALATKGRGTIFQGRWLATPRSFYSWLVMESMKRSQAVPEQYVLQWMKDNHVNDPPAVSDWVDAGVLLYDEKDYPRVLICMERVFGRDGASKAKAIQELSKGSKSALLVAKFLSGVGMGRTGRGEEAMPVFRELIDDPGLAGVRFAGKEMAELVREEMKWLQGEKAK